MSWPINIINFCIIDAYIDLMQASVVIPRCFPSHRDKCYEELQKIGKRMAGSCMTGT